MISFLPSLSEPTVVKFDEVLTFSRFVHLHLLLFVVGSNLVETLEEVLLVLATPHPELVCLVFSVIVGLHDVSYSLFEIGE